jgi:hypothetical protein
VLEFAEYGNRNHQRPRDADRPHQANLRDGRVSDRLDRAFPKLETYLEGEVANGETSETRIT